jgi:hypothetical protein
MSDGGSWAWPAYGASGTSQTWRSFSRFQICIIAHIFRPSGRGPNSPIPNILAPISEEYPPVPPGLHLATRREIHQAIQLLIREAIQPAIQRRIRLPRRLPKQRAIQHGIRPVIQLTTQAAIQAQTHVPTQRATQVSMHRTIRRGIRGDTRPKTGRKRGSRDTPDFLRIRCESGACDRIGRKGIGDFRLTSGDCARARRGRLHACSPRVGQLQRVL